MDQRERTDMMRAFQNLNAAIRELFILICEELGIAKLVDRLATKGD